MVELEKENKRLSHRVQQLQGHITKVCGLLCFDKSANCQLFNAAIKSGES